ncbi:hypothetical protein [Brevundimonas goettingensis]|uniref:PDZ domain-containing protein n=1 Tax=Brevundimonas goettingensis TaxID=2774190 RepID=A0A975BYN0_9CAUL|nr:hypothetical protein [Brevundimonas goettingensis]QTC90028.1 hypothetical protein IFJ75_12095 [Brevundimonas goettingensis]
MSEAAHPILIKQAWVQALKALTIGIALIVSVHACLYALTGLPIDKGFNHTGLRLSPQLDGGFLKVFGVFPDSGAEQAGIREGDRVRFDRALNAYRLHLPVGERVGMTVQTSTGQRHLILTIAPAKAPTLRVEAVLYGLTAILVALAGATIALEVRDCPDLFWVVPSPV